MEEQSLSASARLSSDRSSTNLTASHPWPKPLAAPEFGLTSLPTSVDYTEVRMNSAKIERSIVFQ
ncbi:calcium-transporting ATPase 3 [Aspergillus lentulus]|nr:calcium-transporting ATPase 3 [Aspergillus lentulus]